MPAADEPTHTRNKEQEMNVSVTIQRISPRHYIAEIPGLSVATAEGETPHSALEECMDRAALYLDPKEPEMIEFEVNWSTGDTYVPQGPEPY